MSARKPPLPPPAAGSALADMLRARHAAQAAADTQNDGNAPDPIRSADVADHSSLAGVAGMRDTLPPVSAPPARSAPRRRAPAAPDRPRRTTRSWYLGVDVAEALDAAADDLHYATRQDKRACLEAVIRAGLAHLDEARLSLQATQPQD